MYHGPKWKVALRTARPPLAAWVACLCLTAPSLAQVTELPLQTPKDPGATTEAGIGSYRITRHPDETEVTVFDVDEQFLADCTAEWREVSSSLTCHLGDGGRFRTTWYSRHAVFEDLVRGEEFTLRFTREPGEVRDPDATAQERGWVVEGSKSWEEVEEAWGNVTPLFGYLMGELEITLGIGLKPVDRQNGEP